MRSCKGTFVLTILSCTTFESAFTNMPFIGNSPIAFYEDPPCGTSRFGNTTSWQYGPSCSSSGLTAWPASSPIQSSLPTIKFAAAKYSMKVVSPNYASGFSSCFFMMSTLLFINEPRSPPVTLFANDLTAPFADDTRESPSFSRIPLSLSTIGQ